MVFVVGFFAGDGIVRWLRGLVPAVFGLGRYVANLAFFCF